MAPEPRTLSLFEHEIRGQIAAAKAAVADAVHKADALLEQAARSHLDGLLELARRNGVSTTADEASSTEAAWPDRMTAWRQDVAMPATRHYTGDRGAIGRFDTFLASSVSTVVLVRAFLIVTGYPKVGGGGLHIAHVLWGGLLMAAAIVTVMVHPGSRSKHRAAILGGIGFGLFLDEVGKFLTTDVNYFFKPAIAIIYIVFVGFYVVVREIVLRHPLSDAQRLAVASSALSDLSLGQLTQGARDFAVSLLDDVDAEHAALVGSLRTGLSSSPPVTSTAEGRLTRARERFVARAQPVLDHPRFHRGIMALILIQLLVIAGQFVLLVVHPVAGSSHGSAITRHIAELSCGVSGLYTIWGAVLLLRDDRAGALRVLFQSVLITLLVTQIFVFAEYQASGIVGLAVDVFLLQLLRVAGEAQPQSFSGS